MKRGVLGFESPQATAPSCGKKYMIAMVSLTWKKKAYNYQIKFLI
jgi:hypothetical protein